MSGAVRGSLAGILVGGLCSLGLGIGCSGAEEALRQDIAALDQRVADLERSDSGWQARIDGIEEQMLLLEDRVEAHRLSLERRGMVAARSPNELPAYRAPASQPDYSYMAELPVERVEPSVRPAALVLQPEDDQPDDELEELVITNATLQRFVEENGGAPQPFRTAQEPVVVGERLPVTRLGDGVEREPAGGSNNSAPPAVSSAGGPPLDVYQASLEAFNAGNYPGALEGFRVFLASGPDDDYIDNVHYWIGECLYATGDYEAALASFQRVVRETPDGNKVPDSLLKIGLTYERMNSQEEANQVLATLVESYPLSDAARRASERLADLN